MSLRYALLGLLAEEPASGYDLARKFERNLSRYAWHAQQSQIYPELNRLAADGLATVIEEGPRGRRTYAITEVGRSELRRWVLDPNDEPPGDPTSAPRAEDPSNLATHRTNQ